MSTPNLIEIRDQIEFDYAMRALQGEIANIAAHTTLDSSMRLKYTTLIAEMSSEMRMKVVNGSMTWKQAAAEAHETRNIIMDYIRQRTTPVGRARAEKQKLNGKSFNYLIGKYTQEIYGSSANFNLLTPNQQSYVFKAIVESSGRSKPR